MSLDARPAPLTERHWRLARPVLEEILARESVFAVYLTGSIAAGLGTRLSDVDLVVLVDEDDTASRPDRDFAGDGFICDVQTVSCGSLAAWAADINGFSFNAADYDRVFTHRRKLRDLTRLLMGRPVLGAERLAAVRAELDQARFRACYTTLHLADAATFIRDTPGFMEAGDLETAWETSARALRTAAEAALGACGNVNYSGKFLVRRLLDEPSGRLTARSIRGLLYESAPDWEHGAGLAGVIEDRLAWADRLSTEIFLRALRPTLDPAPLRPPAPRREGSPRHAPGSLVLRTGDGAALLGARSARFDRPAGILWCLIDGSRTPADLCREFAKSVSLPENSARTWVDGQLAEFARSGLLAD